MKENGETNANEEAAGEAPVGSQEDLLDDEPEGESEGVIVSLSRGVGAVARTVTDGLQTVSDALMPRRHVARRPSPDDLPMLLSQLGELVEQHRDAGYATLADTEDFWRLVAKLSAFGRRMRLKRVPDVSRRRAVRRVIDVDAGPPRKRVRKTAADDAGEEKSGGRRSKKKAVEEPDEPKPDEE